LAHFSGCTSGRAYLSHPGDIPAGAVISGGTAVVSSTATVKKTSLTVPVVTTTVITAEKHLLTCLVIRCSGCDKFMEVRIVIKQAGNFDKPQRKDS